MRKYYKFTAFVLATVITTIALTAGISKNSGRDGGGRNLVDELYDQAVKQNDKLEAIEDGIDKFYKKRSEALDKFSSFTSYNNRYYTDARSKAAGITDATTKQKADELLNKSEAAYKIKTADWQNTIAALNVSEKELSNLHALLQIMITEKMIAKYQSDELPDNAKAKEANADLLKVIEKIKAITQ